MAIEAIKLIEGGLSALCDEVWLVVCDEQSQLERLAGRGTPADVAAQRIAAQAGLAERLRPSATLVLDASGDPAMTRVRVVEALAAAVAASRFR